MEKSKIPVDGQAIVIPPHVAARAAERVDVDDYGCHISRYSTGSHGYAQIGWQVGDRRWMTTAHRAAWVHAHGQIPLGMTVDHVCRVQRCVRVEHLRLQTNVDNATNNVPALLARARHLAATAL